MSQTTKDRLITVDEVAARYHVHPRTVMRFVKAGKIPAPLKTNFQKRPSWRESDIDRHLESLQ